MYKINNSRKIFSWGWDSFRDGNFGVLCIKKAEAKSLGVIMNNKGFTWSPAVVTLKHKRKTEQWWCGTGTIYFSNGTVVDFWDKDPDVSYLDFKDFVKEIEKERFEMNEDNILIALIEAQLGLTRGDRFIVTNIDKCDTDYQVYKVPDYGDGLPYYKQGDKVVYMSATEYTELVTKVTNEKALLIVEGTPLFSVLRKTNIGVPYGCLLPKVCIYTMLPNLHEPKFECNSRLTSISFYKGTPMDRACKDCWLTKRKINY